MVREKKKERLTDLSFVFLKFLQANAYRWYMYMYVKIYINVYDATTTLRQSAGIKVDLYMQTLQLSLYGWGGGLGCFTYVASYYRPLRGTYMSCRYRQNLHPYPQRGTVIRREEDRRLSLTRSRLGPGMFACSWGDQRPHLSQARQLDLVYIFATASIPFFLLCSCRVSMPSFKTKQEVLPLLNKTPTLPAFLFQLSGSASGYSYSYSGRQ